MAEQHLLQPTMVFHLREKLNLNIFQYTENAVFEINTYLHESGYNVRKPKIQSVTHLGDY